MSGKSLVARNIGTSLLLSSLVISWVFIIMAFVASDINSSNWTEAQRVVAALMSTSGAVIINAMYFSWS